MLAILRPLAGIVVGESFVRLADALARVAAGENPTDAGFPELEDLAVDAVLDALALAPALGPAFKGIASTLKADGRAAKAVERASGGAKGVAERAGKLMRDESGYARFGRGREVWLARDEYAMVMSELNKMYDARLKGANGPVRVPILNHRYTVEVFGKGEYRIIGRRKLK